jgi:hypothetical protein
VLIKGSVPKDAYTLITSKVHKAHIRSAEDLWQSFTRIVGKVGRVLFVAGVVFTAYDLSMATKRSFDQHSFKPLTAETIRQVGGWGGAIAGAQIGAVVGALFGISTGPGAIVTGAVGAIVFGALGYLGTDLIADQISPN